MLFSWLQPERQRSATDAPPHPVPPLVDEHQPSYSSWPLAALIAARAVMGSGWSLKTYEVETVADIEKRFAWRRFD
jgi:hypothetical protein